MWVTDKLRHETLQRFMLTNDSVTMAIEVPIWFTVEDIAVLEDEHGIELTRRDDPLKRARNYRPHRFPVGVERGRAYPGLCFQFKADGSSYRNKWTARCSLEGGIARLGPLTSPRHRDERLSSRSGV